MNVRNDRPNTSREPKDPGAVLRKLWQTLRRSKLLIDDSRRLLSRMTTK